MHHFHPRVALFLGLLAALAALGCGETTREEQLRAANEAVAISADELGEARALLEEREGALEAAREARDEARGAVEEIERQLAEAEASVGLHATDDVLFRAVQKRLLTDEALSDVAIAASISDAVVTLRGAVPDAALRDHAVEISSAVPGVRQVVSEIAAPAPEPEPEG
jgi:osmotically-inducible protein OsmY